MTPPMSSGQPKVDGMLEHGIVMYDAFCSRCRSSAAPAATHTERLAERDAVRVDGSGNDIAGSRLVHDFFSLGARRRYPTVRFAVQGGPEPERYREQAGGLRRQL